MKRYVAYLAVFITVLTVLVLPLAIAEAQTTRSPGSGVKLENPIGSDSFEELITRITNALVIIGTPVYIVIILIGAFKLMTSAGKPDKVKDAKNIFLYSTIGFLILILSRGIVAIVSSLV